MIISWGIPTIKVTKLVNGEVPSTGAEEVTFATPVEGSTQLSSEKGDKMEALIEGGEPEAVKYKRGKYALEFQIRIGKGRMPSSTDMIDGIDGVVSGEYQVELTPEDWEDGAPGFKMPKSVCSYSDSYTSNDGIIRTYTFDSLKKDKNTAQIAWTVTA